MDSIVCWNVRGLNWPNKQEDLKIFLFNHKVGLVGLLETKVKEHNTKKVADAIFQGWQWHTNFSLNPKGRIWIAWRPNTYRILILSQTEQLIHCHATQLSTNKLFFITFVYGMNKQMQRQPLWNDLYAIAHQITLAWCII